MPWQPPIQPRPYLGLRKQLIGNDRFTQVCSTRNKREGTIIIDAAAGEQNVFGCGTAATCQANGCLANRGLHSQMVKHVAMISEPHCAASE